MGTVGSNNKMICQCLFSGCDVIADIGFLNWTDETELSQQMIYRPSWYNSSNRVDGLVGSCTVLDGLLMSNLTCFHEDTCLNLLLSYFPHLTRVNSKKKKKNIQFKTLLFVKRKCYGMHRQYYLKSTIFNPYQN